MKTYNKNTIEYKGYFGSVEFSLDDDCLFGRVLGIQGSISYEGITLEDLKEDFHQAIDDYLYDCEQEGKAPQKPFSGKLNIRLNSELHRKAALRAKKKNISLNSFIKQAVEHELEY